MKLLGRFRLVGRKERRILELMSDHLDVVIRAVEHLEPMLESAKTGNWKNVEEESSKVRELETLADGIHRDAVVAVSQGAFFSGTREDFLELMEKNDEIADAAQNAAGILAETPIDQKSYLVMYMEPKETLGDLFNRLLSAVRILRESINALETDAEIAVKSTPFRRGARICIRCHPHERVGKEIKTELLISGSQSC